MKTILLLLIPFFLQGQIPEAKFRAIRTAYKNHWDDWIFVREGSQAKKPVEPISVKKSDWVTFSSRTYLDSTRFGTDIDSITYHGNSETISGIKSFNTSHTFITNGGIFNDADQMDIITLSNEYYGKKQTWEFIVDHKHYNEGYQAAQMDMIPYNGLNDQAKADYNRYKKYIISKKRLK